MSDALGILPIPLVAPALGEAVGDPLLTKTLSFFQSALNANAPAAWRAVFKTPNRPDVVQSIVDNDPREAGFNEADLPALYMFREDVKDPLWIAEDYLTRESVCRLFWVMPPGVQANRRLRSSIINGIASALLVVSERNRDPAWIDPGDTDPLAATLGSSFFGRAGWLEFEIGKWRPFPLPIPMIDRGAPPRIYDSLSIACKVVERLVPDLGRYDVLAGIEATFKTPDGGIGDGGVLTGEQILT